LQAADGVVVRGTYHKTYLASAGVSVAAVIQDGVDTRQFRPLNAWEIRTALGLKDGLTIGVLGSINWSPRLRWTTGLELIEALAVIPSPDVRGLIVGDGSGLPILRQTADRLGVSHRIRFVGRIPYGSLPEYINCMDVCLSTQTNDAVGWARTTGKLPLFLACGRFVLANRVGEAARVLPEEMLLECEGAFDSSYPRHLAERIRRLMEGSDLSTLKATSRSIAEREFDYDLLTPRVATVLRAVLNRG
jgi:glycosyltransferase involved in cell wall biosynthesis